MAGMLAWMAALVMVAQAVPPPTPPAPLTMPPEDRVALEAATRDLCGRRVALLGEGPTHGEGRVQAFKVALVRRLVERCGYRAIAFESSSYEFLALDRAARAGNARPAMFTDAVGGLWKFHREFAPLAAFLYPRIAAGDVRVAGLDFQIGGLEEPYANTRMIPELAAGLPDARARECRDRFARHVAWSYTAAEPYGAAQRDALIACVRQMRAVADAAPAGRERDERIAMLRNLARALEASLASPEGARATREAAMFGNLRAFRARLSPRAKVIVWGATVHLAKDAALAEHGGFPSLGRRIHDVDGERAFSLGFSARGGSYRQFRRILPVAAPVPGSIEAATGRGTRYLDRAALRRMGARPAAALDGRYHSADWSHILDGMVVFDTEWPARSTRPGYQ